MHITDLPAGNGILGLTLCPGILLHPDDPPVSERRLGLHLQAVQDWGAVTLVSLLEDYEFELLNVTRMGARAEALGMEWIHLPIEHHSLPDDWFEVHWPYAGHRILHRLREGSKVAIHCRAGFGRTGTVAARILTELGISSADAMANVERVQTDLPANIHRIAYLEALNGPRRKWEWENRVLGCLLGGAVGDGLGYDQDLAEWHEVRDETGQVYFEPQQVRTLDLPVSHATQMSLFTLEGLGEVDLTNSADVVARIRLAYLDWMQTQERQPGAARHGDLCLYREMQVKRNPSAASLSSLATGGEGTLLNPLNQTRDCGGLARVAPLGLVPGWDLARTMQTAAEVTAITHGHPEERWSAAAMAGLVHEANQGRCLQDSGRTVCGGLAAHPEAADVVQKLALALKLAQGNVANPLYFTHRLGSGKQAAEALATGLYCALSGRSFADALMIGANQIDNSHVVAALTGQLYGAAHGVADLPHAWIRKLDVFSPANSVIFNFLAIA